MIALLNFLMPMVLDRLIWWENVLMLDASIFLLLLFTNKFKDSVALIHFDVSNLFKSLFVAILGTEIVSGLC